jgi:hypothetical protein
MEMPEMRARADAGAATLSNPVTLANGCGSVHSEDRPAQVDRRTQSTLGVHQPRE